MATHDNEPGVFQSILRILEGDPQHFYPGYYGDGYHGHGHYIRDHYDITDSSNVENDEMIAHTLQEEFAQLELAEDAGYSNVGDQQFHESYHPSNDWYYPNKNNNYSTSSNLDNECSNDESDDTIPSSSCSSPANNEEYAYSPEYTDDCNLDDEVGKRLNQLTPIPHVPRINGDIPSIDEATSDHERLLMRLQVFGFVEVKVQGDGNCQFRALADQLYNTPERHKTVRRQVVDQLKAEPETYEGYVPMEYGEYLRKMSKSGEWGDHVTLQAAADSYGVKILVMTSFKDTCYIEILPINQKHKRVIFLSFWSEVHYNSIFFEGDSSGTEFRKKRRWWNFGSKH